MAAKWMNLTWALMMTLAMKVKGGSWLSGSNTWQGTFYGHICVDPPALDAHCGWKLRVTSDPPLDNINTFHATTTKEDGGRLFYLENLSWNAGEPGTSSAFCTQCQLYGSFGNVRPDYVSVEWDCICVTNICEPLPGSATTATTTEVVTTAPIDVTTTSSDVTAAPISNVGLTIAGRYTKHAGKYHETGEVANHVTNRLNCFWECLQMIGCTGINVAKDSLGYWCSYVMETFDDSYLVNLTTSSFWQLA